MKELFVGADMGSVKIGTKDVSLFINNGFGDGMHEVTIFEEGEKQKSEKITRQMEFEGHFTVKENKKVKMYYYDCAEEEIIYTFKKGRYFCYSIGGFVVIVWNDNDIYA